MSTNEELILWIKTQVRASLAAKGAARKRWKEEQITKEAYVLFCRDSDSRIKTLQDVYRFIQVS